MYLAQGHPTMTNETRDLTCDAGFQLLDANHSAMADSFEHMHTYRVYVQSYQSIHHPFICHIDLNASFDKTLGRLSISLYPLPMIYSHKRLYMTGLKPFPHI